MATFTVTTRKQRVYNFNDDRNITISKSKIGNKHRNTKIVRDDGVIFSSVINAADSINAKPGSVTAVLRGTRKKNIRL